MNQSTKCFALAVTISCLSSPLFAKDTVYFSDTHNPLSQTSQLVEGLVIKRSDTSQVDVAEVLPRALTVSQTNWSVDEQSLSFVADDKYLWTWNTHTGAARLVATLEGGDSVETLWSNDGKWLAFTHQGDAEKEFKVHSITKNRTYRLLNSNGELAAWLVEHFDTALVAKLTETEQPQLVASSFE